MNQQAALAVWCLCIGNSKMKTSFRNSNAFIPLVELLEKQIENFSIVINVIGGITEICKKSSSLLIFFILSLCNIKL